MRIKSDENSIIPLYSGKTFREAGLKGVVIIVSLLMVLTSLVALSGSSPGDSLLISPQATNESAAPVVETESTGSDVPTPTDIINILEANKVPASYAYLPNLNAAGTGKTVTPAYSAAPAPMGVVDYGMISSSGSLQKYQYDATSFSGSIMIEGLQPFYLMNSAPHSVAIQLNVVLNQTTILGVPGYVYWVHSVGLYNPSNGTIQFIDNVWNLSSPAMSLPSSTIYSGGGETIPGLFYYYASPLVYNLPESFTLVLTVRSFMSGNNNAIGFDYEMSSEGTTSFAAGTYDTVVFNSVRSGSSLVTPQAVFHVDGSRTTPSGLLYDAELVLTGPGSGSTTVNYYANDQLTLSYLDSVTLANTNVRAAYNYGSNTGETISGLSVWYTSVKNPIAHLSSGPSLMAPLWGSTISKAGGAVNIQGKIDPENAFVFLNIGSTYNPKTAAWAPINQNGTYSFSMPGGLEYSGAVMLSDYSTYTFTPTAYTVPEVITLAQGGGGGGTNNTTETAAFLNVTLGIDLSLGIYTPLYANGNDQVPYLTVGSTPPGAITGSGLPDDPYIVETNAASSLDALFMKTNPYMYPEFSGIQILNTNVAMVIDHPPALAVDYSSSQATYAQAYGLPMDNFLNYVFYETSGISLWDARVSGWFPNSMHGIPIANVMLIESTDFLIADSIFSVMGSSLLIYNSQGTFGSGTVWGNHFETDNITRASTAMNMLNGNMPTGISVFSSGNLIYNNYFDTARSSYSPHLDPMTGNNGVTYENAWNLPEKQSVSYVNTVNGFNLTGVIVPVGYQGGNFWYSFDGTIPYNDHGNIAYGGDYIPLVLPKYGVTFNAVGLPSDQAWGITLHDVTITSFGGSAIGFDVVNGTSYFSVIKPSIYSANPMYGYVTVSGAAVTVDIVFTIIQFNVEFQETGLPAGSLWSVTLDGFTLSSTTSSISFQKENGTWNYSIAGPVNYSTPASSAVTVDGTDTTQAVTFVYIKYQLTFEETGLPAGSYWILNLDGIEYNLTASTMSIDEFNGSYSYTIISPDDYVSTPSMGTATVSGDAVTVSVVFTLQTYTVGFHSINAPTGTPWEVTFNGVTVNSTESWIYFYVPNGNYTYTIGNVSGYELSTTSGFVVIDHSGASVNVTFTQVSSPSTASQFPTGLVLTVAGIAVVAAIVGFLLFMRKPKP